MLPKLNKLFNGKVQNIAKRTLAPLPVTTGGWRLTVKPGSLRIRISFWT